MTIPEAGVTQTNRDELRAQLQKDRQELLAELERATVAANKAERSVLSWIAACDRGELWREDDCRNSTEWVSQKLDVSRWKASRLIQAGHALERLPLTEAALEAGAISLDKALELTRLVTPETEEDLLRWARRVSTGAIRERADLATKPPKDAAEQSHGFRSLTTWREDDLTIGINALLPNDKGAIVLKALDLIADNLPTEPQDEEAVMDEATWRRETIDRRRADAWVLMASGHMTGDKSPDRATVVVHTPLEALSDDSTFGTDERGRVLHPDTVRKLSCDSRLQFVLHGRNGNAVGIGRTAQQVPHWLRRQVVHRDDNRCTFPNCEARRFLHPHHIKHWAHGGPTDLDNLITVCTTHHDLVHDGRWSVHRDGHGNITWFRPGGRVYQRGPAPPTREEVEGRDRPPDPPRMIEARHFSRLLAYAAVL